MRYCTIFEKIIKLIPQVMEWAKPLEAGVFSEESPEKSPANNRGQHQLPTRAGIEKQSVAMATQVDWLFSSSMSVACCWDVEAEADPVVVD